MLQEKAAEGLVDFQGKLHDAVELGFVDQFQSKRVVARNHRVVEFVVFQMELDRRPGKGLSFRHTEALREASCRDIAHHHFERNHLGMPHHGVSLVYLVYEMSRDALVVQKSEDAIGDAVVQKALAFDGLLALSVQRRGVIFVFDDQFVGCIGRPYLFRLAFVEHFFFCRGFHHRFFSPSLVSKRFFFVLAGMGVG